jgi:hypothetical protein
MQMIKNKGLTVGLKWITCLINGEAIPAHVLDDEAVPESLTLLPQTPAVLQVVEGHKQGLRRHGRPCTLT